MPPDVVGAGHDTATGWFWSDTPDWAAGHVIVNVTGGGGVGVVGESPHRAASVDSATTATRARRVRPWDIGIS